MKKFTFMLLAAFVAVAAMAAGPQKQILKEIPFNAQLQMGQKFNAKQVPGASFDVSKRAKAPKKVTSAADLAGDYTWDYQTANESSTDLDSITTTAGSSHVTIAQSTTTEGGITISGMFPNAVEATIESGENVDYFIIKAEQTAGTSSYGDYTVYGLYYFEGNEETEAGWYYSDIYGYVQEDGVIAIYPWICRVLTTGNYAGYSLTPYWVEGSILTPSDPLSVVTLPEGAEAKEYVMSYDNGSTPVNVAVFNDEVYFQGMSTFIPEAWVKGTKDGNTVTFAAMQYMGEYGSYGSSFFFYNGETVFTYDPDADTYSAEGKVFGVLADQYYDGNYTNPVIAPVSEKAVMPANPEITSLKEGNYGWYLNFSVPIVDVNGEPLVASKLYYMIYTDTEGEIAPLTFTPATHTRLTEDMTEIPYGFTEGWDIYADQIYLNELYSSEWNNLGIQSIYYGGDEVNATEIQWFFIKDYSGPVEVTFNFNAMDVPTSSNVTTDGDITEDVQMTEGDVTLTVSPKSTGNTQNRFWSTSAGPQLRVYSGTLTFSVPEGQTITQIVFNHNGKWGANSVDGVEIPNDADNKVATWTGEAQEVVVTIAANSQINNIVVTVTGDGGTVDPGVDELVVLPEGVEPIEYTLTANGYTSQSSIGIEETVNVAFDGTDVYLQGLAYYFPDAYVKGTLTEEGQVIVPSGQFVGEDEYGPEYLIALDVDEEQNFVLDESFIFDYNAESGELTLTGMYGESGTKDVDALWDYFEEATYTLGALVLPDPVVAPDNLETETWYLTCDSYNGKIRGRELQVGVDGNDMYIQGLCEYLPEAWVKGTIDEDGQTVTFASGQFYGTFNDSYRLFFVGYDSDTQGVADVVFSIDSEAGTLSTDLWIILNGKQNEISYYDYYLDVVISNEMPELPEAIVAPEDLVTEAYHFSGFDTFYEEDATGEVQVGFYGENLVYFQGLSQYVKDAWVVGTIEDGVVTIPETYMGIYESYYGDSEVYFSGTSFVYDAEAGTFTSEAGFVTYESPEDEYKMDEFTNVVLTKLYDVAATPADPEITEFTATGNYPKIKFNIPTVDVNGTLLVQANLTYQIFIEKDDEVQPLVLAAELYDKLDEDMSEIPYGFSDGWDIYTSTVYLNQSVEEIATWVKIGIQSIYYGGGECNKSNIVWVVNDSSTAISQINADNQQNVIYNIAGQRVQKAQKGIFIVNGKKMFVK